MKRTIEKAKVIQTSISTATSQTEPTTEKRILIKIDKTLSSMRHSNMVRDVTIEELLDQLKLARFIDIIITKISSLKGNENTFFLNESINN